MIFVVLPLCFSESNAPSQGSCRIVLSSPLVVLCYSCSSRFQLRQRWAGVKECTGKMEERVFGKCLYCICFFRGFLLHFSASELSGLFAYISGKWLYCA